MNLRHLETFLLAARLGSFASVAQKLNATPSTVSMRIQEVENRLNTVLFDRSQRNARLTQEGLRLLPYVDEVICSYQRLMEESVSSAREITGYVRLGVTENVAITWLPDMIKAIRSDHPSIKIELEIGISHHIGEMLERRALDMALAACELPPSRYHSTPLQSIDFRWMCSPDMNGIPDVVTPEALSELPVLSVTREWQASGTHLRWFTENKVHYRNVTICNTFRTTASMAINGLGLAQLPVGLFESEVTKGRLIILKAEPEIPPLDILAIRPAGDDSLVYRAIEAAAQKAAATV
nr:LysR family transcriptional regulator [Brucella anthropi]